VLSVARDAEHTNLSLAMQKLSLLFTFSGKIAYNSKESARVFFPPLIAAEIGDMLGEGVHVRNTCML
jgi:hypothetical protein